MGNGSRSMNAFTELLTIGHSTHSWDRFSTMLSETRVTAIADVRSAPYSRYSPQFDQSELQLRLKAQSIAYVFLGRELGGRPSDPMLYTDGVADYEKMASVVPFKDGLQRLIDGAGQYRIALMCSEHDPLDCHRCLLVSRRLMENGINVSHILASGAIVSHSVIEQRLLADAGMNKSDLFLSNEDQLAAAYRRRGLRVAFSDADIGRKFSAAR